MGLVGDQGALTPGFEGTDLKNVPADRLAGVARQLYNNKKYLQAIHLLHYATVKRVTDGRDFAGVTAQCGPGLAQ